MARKIEVGHQVEVARKITRKEGVYAEAGERGVVVEIFRQARTGSGPLAWYAKVRMGGPTAPLKTFRLTSLDRL